MASVDYGQCRALPDFAVRYMFDLQFIRRPAGVLIPGDFGLRVTASNIPTRTDNEPDALFFHGHQVSQPGVEGTEGTLDLTLFESVSMPVFQMIETWRNLNRQNETGIMAPRGSVTADLRLKLLNRQKQPIWAFDLLDAFILSDDKGGLDGTTRSGAMNDISMSLSYDHMTQGPA